MSRKIFAALLTVAAFLFAGCGSGGSDSSCGPVIQNVNLPQNVPTTNNPVTVPDMPAADAMEARTIANGGEIYSKDANVDGTVTLTGCQIVSTGDTDSHDGSSNTSTTNP